MFYFYMPGNSAQTEEAALKLNITFGDQTKTLTLCTLPPKQNEGYVDYTINRNSIYRFNLKLKKVPRQGAESVKDWHLLQQLPIAERIRKFTSKYFNIDRDRI